MFPCTKLGPDGIWVFVGAGSIPGLVLEVLFIPMVASLKLTTGIKYIGIL